MSMGTCKIWGAIEWASE